MRFRKTVSGSTRNPRLGTCKRAREQGGLPGLRPHRTTGLLVALGLVGILALPPMAAAQRKSLRVSYPAPVTVYLPLWIAAEAGLFSKHVLDVELVHVGSSPIAMAAYLAGEIDILGGGG